MLTALAQTDMLLILPDVSKGAARDQTGLLCDSEGHSLPSLRLADVI